MGGRVSVVEFDFDDGKSAGIDLDLDVAPLCVAASIS